MHRRSFLAMTASLALFPLARLTTAQTPVEAADTDLRAMLRLLPDKGLHDKWLVTYANYELQLATIGVGPDPSNMDFSTWLEALRELGVPRAMEQAPKDLIWRDSFGFDVRDIDAYLESNSITIMRGSLEALSPARLRHMGYEPIETDGVAWYTIGDVNLLETDHMIHRLHVGRFRHLAVLDSRTVICTTDRVDMERVLALHAGAPGAFADGRGAALAAPSGDAYCSMLIANR